MMPDLTAMRARVQELRAEGEPVLLRHLFFWAWTCFTAFAAWQVLQFPLWLMLRFLVNTNIRDPTEVSGAIVLYGVCAWLVWRITVLFAKLLGILISAPAIFRIYRSEH